MEKKLELTDNYFGQKCKKMIGPKSFVSQEEVIELENKYPEYEIKEIGYQEDRIGYRFVYAAFAK